MGKILLSFYLITLAFGNLSGGTEFGLNGKSSFTQESVLDLASYNNDSTENEAPLGHTHGCETGDFCGHNCHVGHCSFTITNGFNFQFNLVDVIVSKQLDVFYNSYNMSLFRPPIA